MTLAFISGVGHAERHTEPDKAQAAPRPLPETACLHTRVLTSACGLTDIEQDWRALHQRSGGTVFHSYEWLVTWYSILESRLPVRVLTCWNDHTLVGLFPFSVQPIHLGIRRVNRVRLAGEYGVCGEYAPLVDPEFLEPCTNAVADYLAAELAAGRIDFCDFSAFRVESPVMLSLAEALRHRDLLVGWDAAYMPRVSIPLPATWDEYLKALKGSQRRELKGDTKALNRPDVRFEVIRDPDTAQTMMEHLIRLHNAIWKRRGAGGHFRTDKYFEKFLRTVTPLLLRQDGATVYALSHNDRPAVIILNFHCGRHYTAYITGRDLDTALSAHSPGRTLFAFSIKDAIERGFTDFDFLGGDQPYKLSLGGVMTYYGRLVARQKGAAGVPAQIAHGLLEARYHLHIKFYRHRVLPKLNKTFRNRKRAAVNHP